MNEIIQKYVKKIEKLHKQLEKETNERFEITIYQPEIFKEVKIGDFYHRKSYQVYDALPTYHPLEGNYHSISELETKIKDLYKNDLIRVHDGYLGLGKGAIRKIASIRVL